MTPSPKPSSEIEINWEGVNQTTGLPDNRQKIKDRSRRRCELCEAITSEVKQSEL